MVSTGVAMVSTGVAMVSIRWTEKEDECLGNIVISGYFNLYHRMRQDNARTQHQLAEDLVEWMFEKELLLASTPKIWTHHKAGNVRDLVLASPEMVAELEFLDVAEDTGRDFFVRPLCATLATGSGDRRDDSGL
jgi:hypothetical protein